MNELDIRTADEKIEEEEEKSDKIEEVNQKVENKIIDTKISLLTFFENLLSSRSVKLWFMVLFWGLLIVLFWFLSVSLCDIFYSDKPKEIFINIYKKGFDVIKTSFAAIGLFMVVVKLFIKGKF